MTTPTVTSSIDSQMHNNIMAVGSRDCPPMLAIGRYPQCCPYKHTTVVVQAVAATDDSPAILKHTTFETPMNMAPANKAHFEAEKEAIHLILTEIRDEIYSTVDACQTAQEMWEAIERLQQGKSLNIQDPEWSRFVTIVKKQHKLDEVCYHNLFDILKQYQKEVNELHAERLAMNANPLALVATAQENQDPYYQTPKSQKSYAPSSKPHDPEQAQADKDMQKNLALIAKYFKKIYKPTNNNLRTSSNLRNKNVDTTLRYKNDNQSRQFGNQRTMNVSGARENVGSPVAQQSGIQCFNCKEFGHFSKECRKPKRVIDSAYHKEKMLLWKQAEKADTCTNSDPLEQVQNDTGYNVFANDLQHSEQSKSVSNTCIVETDDSNVIPDLPDMCDDVIQNDQNDVESDDKCVALANLKLDTSKTLGESNSVRDSCLVALQNKHTEFEKYKAFNDCTVDYDKLERKLNETLGQLAQKDIEIKEGLKLKTYENSVVKEKHNELIKQSLLTKSHYDGLVKQKTKDMEILIQTCLIPLTLKTQNDSFIFVHELKQEMHADLKTTQTRAPQSPQNVRNTNPRVSTFIELNHKTNVSRPQHRSNQLKDKVVSNNSQVKLKKTQVEEHPRISSISNKIKSITTCNDILNSKTSNANVVCDTCEKSLVDSDHFACVTKMLNDVNARTKKPKVVPISTRKPKGHINKSIATPHKKKVA
nr:hypothetical protein [Tanacetum cinerariifolium]